MSNFPLSNMLMGLIKKLSGDAQRQKIIARILVVSIIICSITLVSLSVFVNISKTEYYDEVIKSAIEVENNIIQLNSEILKLDRDSAEVNRVSTDQMLFVDMNDMSDFVDIFSKSIEKSDYTVQFKITDTDSDKFDIYKTFIDFEFLNFKSDGTGYKRLMDSLNRFILSSDKKFVIKEFLINGNMNDVATAKITLELWCNFKYEVK